MNKFIQEGGRSFRELNGRYINPYKPGSAEFNDFERGWSQALKRSPEQPLRDSRAIKRTPRQRRIALPKLISVRKEREMSEHIYSMLADRAIENLLSHPLYEAPKYGWRTKVYYARVEGIEMPLWKIGVTSNNLDRRYCVSERRLIVEIKTWQYASREEAEAIEREVLTEFANYKYEGDPVLRPGGDSELFTRDVLKLDSQDDFFAMVRRREHVKS